MSDGPVKLIRVGGRKSSRYLRPDGTEPEIGETIEVHQALATALLLRGYELAPKRTRKPKAETTSKPDEAPKADEE